MELRTIAREHPAGQWHGGKKAAPFGVAVGAQFGLPGHGEEVEPMPERRKRISDSRKWIVPVERRR